MYETIIQYGGNKAMDDETRELAIKLGSQLGHVAKGDPNPNVGKGKLFALRKSRKKERFLSILNSFQLRYNEFSINKKILLTLCNENFDYFKQLTMISALNSFNYKS